MFFTYPIDAAEPNWISSTLLDVIRNALEALKQGVEPPNFQDAIPELYRPEFSRGRKFSDLYNAFVEACRQLNVEQLGLVEAASIEQNQFPGLFELNATCPMIADTFPAIHQAAKNLFEYAFAKLSDLKTPESAQSVRARYHEIVHAHIQSGCCPFCGYEILEAPDPDLVDPDLDHYLAISKYPFAGANLRNLTAMGTICNRSYKGAQDILLNELSQKVECMDPYGNEQVDISLEGTILLSSEGKGPEWALTFNPDLKSRNWRRVFSLEARLKSNVLNKQYQTWLRHFISYAQRHNIDLTNRGGVLEAVARFKDACEYETLPTIARLKASFFELVEAALADPEAGHRMHNFVIELQAA